MRAPRISSNPHCFPWAGLWSYGGSLIQTLLGMRHFTFFHIQWTARLFSNCHTEGRLIRCSSKTALLLPKFLIERSLFCECIVKVIFFAVNLPSQITVLSLRISYVFSLLSHLNLPLSCPEPFVANRARRSEVFKVDVWVGNRPNLNVAYGSLPSAFCSPQACGACQLSLVSAPHKANAHMLPASHSALRKSRDAHEVVKLRWTSLCSIWLVTYRANIKCKPQNYFDCNAPREKCRILYTNLTCWIFYSPYGKVYKVYHSRKQP